MHPHNMTGRWFKCLNCWNYSLRPMECCGENMVEEKEDDEAQVILIYNDEEN